MDARGRPDRRSGRNRFDAVVVGSGVGGMCAASLLAHNGFRVMLVEKRRYLGGRFSTVVHDGYRCATGGLAVPVGHNLEQVCAAIGVPSGVRPSARVGAWVAGAYFDLSTGGTRAIIGRVAENPAEARRVLEALGRGRGGEPIEGGLSFRDWLAKYTSNPRIHGIFQATIASLLTVNSNELPAAEYFRVMKVIAPLTFGFIDGGSLALWERMAERIRACGGEVRTAAAACAIRVRRGHAAGVRIRLGQRDVNIDAPVVISNVGPVGTAALVADGQLAPAYLDHLRETVQPTAILWLHFSSDEQLFEYSALSVACSRRVNMIDVPSMEAASIAPPGKHLYTVGAAPLNSLDPGNIRLEFDEVMKDLEEIIPGFDRRCRVLTRTCYRGKWPGFRTVPGSHVGHLTPIDGLYNVGDAACPSGYEGSMGAAKSAQLVFESLHGSLATAARR